MFNERNFLDAGIEWNDPDLGIAWPVTPDNTVVSDKGQRLPRWCDLTAPFSYAGMA